MFPPEDRVAQEDVLFQKADGTVWVTPTRVGLDDKIYQLSLFTMVMADRVPAKKWDFVLRRSQSEGGIRKGRGSALGQNKG